ncbi:MAG: hypothetical protein HN413_00525 [Chloroflexi bacterium]|nr:hypothetical protein [Chloroflexota bacterium]
MGNIKNLIYLSLIEAGASFLALLLIPRDVSNFSILGYSPVRFAFLVGVLVYILFLSGATIFAHRSRDFSQRVKNTLETLYQNENRTYGLFVVLLIDVFLCTGVLISWLFAHRGYYPLLLRLSPIAALLVFLGVQNLIFLVLHMSKERRNILRRKLLEIALILLISTALGTITVYIQIWWKGLDWLTQGTQIQRHQDVLAGVAGNPWQYRVLANYLVETIIRVLIMLDINQPEAVGFIGLRFIQDVLIFGVASVYYRSLGLNRYTAILGVVLLASAFPPAYYDSDLQFNTYFDILFYLAAGLLILRKKYGWIIPLMALAALNRETSGLIPIMLFGHLVYRRPLKRISIKNSIIFMSAMFVYGVIFFGLRTFYNPQELVIPYGHPPGWELFSFNVQRPVTWIQLFKTLGLLPLLAVFSFKKWPSSLSERQVL